MALAELLSSLRTKRQATERSAFGEYLAAVKSLAAGDEIDSDEAAAVLDAAGVDESKLESDVGIQQQRLAWYSQLQAHRQASIDRVQAEADCRKAQAALQAEIDKLQPKIEAAQQRMRTADQIRLSTMQAESWLAENILDVELLAKERELNAELKPVNAELKPLMEDQSHKKTALSNAEWRLQQIQSRGTGNNWTGFGGAIWQVLPDEKPLREEIANLKSELSQLENAIQPRLQEQLRLESELAKIYEQKLEL